MENRGRKARPQEVKAGSTTSRVDYDDGCYTIWTWNRKENPFAPVSVETFHPKWYVFPETPDSIRYEKELAKAKKRELKDSLKKKRKANPITKQKFLAPSGKMVGYTRAKALGLIK